MVILNQFAIIVWILLSEFYGLAVFCHLGLWSWGTYNPSFFKGKKLIDQNKSLLQLNQMRWSHKWNWSRGNTGFKQSVSSNENHAFLWTIVFNLLIKDSPVAVHILLCLFWSENRLKTERPLLIFWKLSITVLVWWRSLFSLRFGANIEMDIYIVNGRREKKPCDCLQVIISSQWMYHGEAYGEASL